MYVHVQCTLYIHVHYVEHIKYSTCIHMSIHTLYMYIHKRDHSKTHREREGRYHCFAVFSHFMPLMSQNLHS